jgi:micrococcal nuclease
MYTYRAKLLRVIDGDTLDVFVDLGFDIWIKRRVRLIGLDAYETRTRNRREKAKGLLAKARLEEALASEKEFLLISHGVGKYGRCLGEILLTERYIKSKKYHGKSINEMLVKEGHARKMKK